MKWPLRKDSHTDKDSGTPPGRQDNGRYILSLYPELGKTYLFEAISQVVFYMGEEGLDQKKYGVRMLMNIRTEFSRNTSGGWVAEIHFDGLKASMLHFEGLPAADKKVDAADAVEWNMMWDAVSKGKIVNTLNNRGKLIQSKGEPEIVKQLIAGINRVNPLSLPINMKSYQGWIKDWIIDKIPPRLFQLFPDGEVKEGKTWTIVLREGGVVPLQVMSTFTFDHTDGVWAHLKATGPVSCEKVLSQLFYQPSNWTMKGRELATYTIEMGTGLLQTGLIKGSAEGYYEYSKEAVPSRMEYELSVERRNTVHLTRIS